MERTILKHILFSALVLLSALNANARTINAVDFGADPTGKKLSSDAINKAIETLNHEGGGVLTLTTGTYLCGSIRMLSHVELNLQAGATIRATTDKKAYDPAEPFDGPEYQDGGHTYFHNSLIWADGAEDIAITGRGLIDGEGLTRHDTETAGKVHGGSIGTGDKAIAFKLCRDVLIRDVKIYRGGHFGIITTGCDYLTIDNVLIDTNRDGIDIDCCRHVCVSNCKVNTPHDDAIVLKSSYALHEARPCEDVMVNNCLVTGYKLGTAMDGTYVPETVNWVCGRIKLGTESNGGYRNITIANCTCLYSSGLAFEEVDQGIMDNIVVTNIAMRHVHHYPIYITTGKRNRGPQLEGVYSQAANISISNVVADDCDSLSGIHISGMPECKLRNISLRDIYVTYRGGVEQKPSVDNYPELDTKYPEIAKFLGLAPVYGLLVRHVEGLRINGLHMSLMGSDARPAIGMKDVVDARLTDVSQPTPTTDNVYIDCKKLTTAF